MPIPIIVYLVALAGLTTDISAATTIKVDDKSFAIVVPVREKDKYISVTVVTHENEEEFCHGSSECFEEDIVTEAPVVLDEKKTEQAKKPAQ